MIKRALMVLMVLLLCGCSGNKIALWGLSSSHTDATGRIGVDRGGAEVGIVAKQVISDEIEWGPEPDLVGAYAIFHLTQDVTIADTEEHSPLQPILEALHARPYVGVEIVGSTDERARHAQPNWIAGTRFSLHPEGSIAIVTEYLDGDQARGDVFVGLRVAF